MPDTVTRTAPKRIWLQVSDDVTDAREPFPAPDENMTWCQDRVTACEVEYVRADLVRAVIRLRQNDPALRVLSQALGLEVNKASHHDS